MKERLTILIFLCSSLFVTAQSNLLSPTIDFEVKDLLLKDAIIQLSHQTQIAFSSPGNLLPAKKINLALSAQPIKKVVEKILQGTAISFKVDKGQIILFETITYFTISGHITERESGEQLPLATVYEAKTKKGMDSNDYGFYSITLPKGLVQLHFSYTGCEEITKRINLQKNRTLNISLRSHANSLAEVVVVSKKRNDILHINTNTNALSIQKMQQLPSLGGESDLLRTVSLMSGVTSGPDGFGGINIRGGNADQNLILLDGVPIYNPLHTGGIYSIFDEHILHSAKLYKGDAPARYGGRLSSVLDVKMKEGDRNKMVRRASIGLTTAKVSLEGPIQKGKSSFIVALRQSLFNTYLKPISKHLKERKGDIGQTGHGFTDLNTKINYSIGTKDQLYLSIYHGRDGFQDKNQSDIAGLQLRMVQHNQDLNWGNTITAFRWNHLFNNKLFVNTTITSSKSYYQSEEYYQEDITVAGQEEAPEEKGTLFYSLYNSSINDKTAKIDFDYLPTTQHAIRFGGEAIAHRFQPGAFTLNQSSLIQVSNLSHQDTINSYSNTIHSQEYSAYLEDQINFTDWLRINIGGRASLLAVQGKQYWSFQPRLSSRLKISDKLMLQAAIGKTNQNLHLLTSSSVGLPSDLWVSATNKVRPQTAWQTTISATTAIAAGISLEVSAYQKWMNHLITYQEGASFLVESVSLNASDWEAKIATGTGKSYGIEFFLKKETGPLTGWINYTYSKSIRQFDDINFGEAYNFKFDRPHSLKIASVYQVSPKINISANWSYQSGLPTTLPTSAYTFYSSNLFSPTAVLTTSSKNSVRLPAYHRMDISLQLDVGETAGQHLLKLGVYNIYNRKNPLYYRLKEKADGSGEREFVQVTLLPILPSLSYSVKW